MYIYIYRLNFNCFLNSSRHKLDYFKDCFNFLDSGAIIFPILIIPFRIANLPVQWIFASLGYLSQTLRGLKFAAVLRYEVTVF